MRDAATLAKGLHQLERKVVPHLATAGTLGALATASGLKEVEAMRALQWLEGKGCLTITTKEQETLSITEKGKAAQKEGLPERHVLKALIAKKELPVSEIPQHLPAYDTGATGAVMGALKKLGVPFITTKEGKAAFKYVQGITIAVAESEKILQTSAQTGWKVTVTKENEKGVKELLKRKGYALLEKHRSKHYSLTPLGQQLTQETDITKAYAEKLTPEMLKSGKWEEFRPYNVEINVPTRTGGRAHFVNEAIRYIKQIWIEMGFQEMEGNHVQTAFWDLDALFVPQDHPAREMQDTFYIENPSTGKLPAAVHKKVKAAHEHGGDTGSLGWRYTYSDKEAAKNLLRTHTTVLSAQTLSKIKEGKLPMPGKYFSVNTVYRNEAIDWKHLFEFHQVEGIVVAEGTTFAHLKGYLREFFGKMGFPNVRIRPAHFPYTEPSAEVDVWDPQKKEWVELGGSGIFRPEVTKTLIGKEVPVLAWGLGMERIIKEYYGFEDIRDLYRNDIDQLKNVKAWLK